jgi:hypothetical protein
LLKRLGILMMLNFKISLKQTAKAEWVTGRLPGKGGQSDNAARLQKAHLLTAVSPSSSRRIFEITQGDKLIPTQR